MTLDEYKKRLLRIWLLGFVGLTILAGSVNWMRLYRLSRDGVPTDVTVSALEPEQHKTVKYTYVAGGMSYEGEGRGGSGNPAFEQIKVGDKLKGYYEAGNPSESSLGDPAPQLARETLFIALLAFLVPSLVVVRAYFRFKKWLREQSAPA
jgi:hypothetical protein